MRSMHLGHNGTREGSSWPSFWRSNSFRKSPWGRLSRRPTRSPAERVIQGDVVTVEPSVAIGVILEATLSGVPEPLCRVGHGFLIRTCSRFRTRSRPGGGPRCWSGKPGKVARSGFRHRPGGAVRSAVAGGGGHPAEAAGHVRWRGRSPAPGRDRRRTGPGTLPRRW